MASQKFDPNLLHREWQHITAEDTADTMVFRPTGSVRSPSRGGLQLALAPGAKVVVTSIGRGDAPDSSEGTWRLGGTDGDEIHVRLDSGEMRRLQIVELHQDRLIVKKE